MKDILPPALDDLSRNFLLLISPNLLISTGKRGKGMRSLVGVLSLLLTCKDAISIWHKLTDVGTIRVLESLSTQVRSGVFHSAGRAIDF